MVPLPVALGLTLCDAVIIEQGTNKASLIGTFSTFRAGQFPFTPLPFCVFAPLTDAQGDADVSLTIERLESNERIEEASQRVRFPGRFAEVRVLFRLATCTFPQSGTYLFTLLVDGEWVAHRRVRVLPREMNS